MSLIWFAAVAFGIVSLFVILECGSPRRAYQEFTKDGTLALMENLLAVLLWTFILWLGFSVAYLLIDHLGVTLGILWILGGLIVLRVLMAIFEPAHQPFHDYD